MKNLCIVNDGDWYGYLFALCLLSDKNFNVSFHRLPTNNNLKKQNCIDKSFIEYLKKYNIDILNNINEIGGSLNFNKCFKNFFTENDITYISDEDNILNTSKEINFLLDFINYEDEELSKDLIESIYPSILWSKNNILPRDVEDFKFNINFDYDLFIDFLLQKCLTHNNFNLIEHVDKSNYDICLDNTYDNYLNNKIEYTDIDQFTYTLTQDKLEYFNKDIQLKNSIDYICDEFIIEEHIPEYNHIIVNRFDFLKKEKTNKVCNYYFHDNVFNIGIAYLKFDFSFNFSHIINDYVFEQTLHILLENDFRHSRIKNIQEESLKKINYVKNFISYMFLYSRRNVGSFWYQFNTESFYESIMNEKINHQLLTNSNSLLKFIRNLFFNTTHRSANVYTEQLYLIYDILVNNKTLKNHLNRHSYNQNRYLKKHVYKEKEELNLLR